MTLTTHIAVGAGVAAPFITSGHPVLGIAIGFASHYALDIIPHWSYRLNSIENSKIEVRTNRKFGGDMVEIIFDIAKTALDFLLGIVLLLFISGVTGVFSLPILLAGVAGALPDGLQGIQLIYKNFPIPNLQKFHDYFHFDNGGENDLPFTWKRFGFQFALVCVSLLIISIV